MGSFLSTSRGSSSSGDVDKVSRNDTCKRQKISSEFYDLGARLIPYLPDELSLQIIARLPRLFYLNLRLVSRKWKAAVKSYELYQLRKELKMTEEWLYLLTKADNKYFWHALDPISRKWQRLPAMPSVVDEDSSHKIFSGLWMWNMVAPSSKVVDFVRGWLGKKHLLNEMPFCGCAVGAVDGCLYVLGGFYKASTLKHVWRFDPVEHTWSELASMSTGRAYCKTAILNNKLYVVGGVSQSRGGLDPLQSAEVFDPSTGAWSDAPNMPFSRAQVLPTAFLADMLKPIATGMTSYKGKLYVPQSLYSWPFFFDVGGEIYDPETNMWEEMPSGMGEGWPAKQAGTKLSVVVDDELYAFEPSSSLDSGKIKVYDQNEDAWKIVIGRVPIYDFADSESPYLLAAFHSKLHFITKDADCKISILCADLRDKFEQFPSSSTSSLPSSLHREYGNESDAVVWKVISTRDFGPVELVSCQVIDM